MNSLASSSEPVVKGHSSEKVNETDLLPIETRSNSKMPERSSEVNTNTDMSPSAIPDKVPSESYLPVESNHVQAILHQCGSFGVQYPIQTKLNKLDSNPSELHGDEDHLLQKALMLTEMYDKNVEALKDNRYIDMRPDCVTSIDTINVPSNLVQSCGTPNEAPILSQVDCVPNCRCKKVLDILAQMQAEPLDKNGILINDGFDMIESVIECVMNEGVTRDVDRKKNCSSPSDEEGKRYDVNDVKTDLNGGSSINETKIELSPNDYLPINDNHVEAILEHGEAFGVQFPIQTKLKGEFDEKGRIKKSAHNETNCHRFFSNKPQTKDIENAGCMKLTKARKNNTTHDQYECDNYVHLKQKTTKSARGTYSKPILSLIPQLPQTLFVPSKEVVNKNHYNNYPEKQKSDPFMIKVLKQSGGEDTLRAITSQNIPMQNEQTNRKGKRPFSILRGNIFNGAGKPFLTEREAEKFPKKCRRWWGARTKMR